MFKFVILALFSLLIKGDFVNVNVQREVDLSKSIIRSKTVLKVENSGNVKLKIYEIPLEFPIEFFSVKSTSKNLDAKQENSKILVSVDLKPSENIEFELSLVFTRGLEPLPKKVKQFDKQSLIYKGNAYFYSSYLTKEQATIVILPNSNDLLSKLSGPKPFNKKGKEITFGPFKNIEKLSTQKTNIHFYSTNSLLSASKVEKIVQVGQLGQNVNFLEYYTLSHKGAMYKFHFLND